MTGVWGSSEIREESRGADSAPSQQRDLSEMLSASRGEKRPLPTTAPPPHADLADDKRARLAEGVLISEDSCPTTPEKNIQLRVSFERRKSSESGDWEEKRVVRAKVERVEGLTVGIPVAESMPRKIGSSPEDENDRSLPEGEGVNVKEEKEEDAANVKEEHASNVKEEHASDVKEEHGEFVRGGGVVRVKEEYEEVASNAGPVNVKVEHGGVDEGEAVNCSGERDGDVKVGAADVQQMPFLGYVRATIRGRNHNSGVVRKKEALSFVRGYGIEVYNQLGEKVGSIEAPLGRYLTPLIETGTIQISTVVDSGWWDGYKIFENVWIQCHPQISDKVLRDLHLRRDVGGGWELFRTETFERTKPSPDQRKVLEGSGTWDGEDFVSYEDLDRAVRIALRKLYDSNLNCVDICERGR